MNRRAEKMRQRRWMTLALATAAAGTSVVAPPAARGVTRYWGTSVGSGSWNNSANWSATLGGTVGASVPTTGDFAALQFADGTNRTITLDISTAPQFFLMGNSGAGTLTFSQTSAVNLSASQYEYVGYTGNAVHSQSAGANSYPIKLDLGVNAGVVGTYNLSGTGSISIGDGGGIYVGDSGGGVFNQSAGSVTMGASTGANLNVGWSSGSSGTYALSGTGTLLVIGTGAENVGFNTTGTGFDSGQFTQIGGTNTTPTLNVGNSAATTGQYGLSGTGVLNVTGTETIGRATFTQGGGTHTVSQLNLSGAGGIGGTYNLSGSASLIVTTSENVEFDSTGALGGFNQTGGTHTTPNLLIGNDAATTGIYNLSGTGSLTATNETVGGSGRGIFAQNGGTHVVTQYLTLGTGSGSGSYSLIAGSLTVGATENISAGSTFTQLGGTNTLPATAGGGQVGLTVNGRYDMSGGALFTSFFSVVDGSSTVAGLFTQSGGTHTVGSPGGLASLIISLNVGGSATYTLSGAGVLNVNGYADVGGATIDGVGSVPEGAGVLNISSGAMTVSNRIKIWDTAGTALNFSGGSLTTLGFEGVGSRFNWTGGTLTITGTTFALGSADFLSSMTLGAGKNLNVVGMTLDSGGMLSLNGGGFSYAAPIILAGGTLNGTSLITNPTQMSGYGTIGGSGGFNTSGTLTVGGILTLSNSGALANSGTIGLTAGSRLQLTGANLANVGTINLGGGTVSGAATLNNNLGGVIAGSGTISAPLSNNAGGTVLLQGGGMLSGAALTNNGLIRGDGFMSNALTNGATGEIRAESRKTITFSAMSAANAGKISLLGGTAEFNLALTNGAAGVIVGQGTLEADAGLVNNGQVQLSGGINNVFGAVTGNSSSKVIVAGNSTATFYNPVTMNSGSEFRVSTGSTAVFFAPVTGTSFFTGGGMKDFESGSSLLTQLITAGGSSMVQHSAALTASVIRENSLEVDGTVTISPDGTAAGTSHLTTLTLLGSGRLDLSNNHLVVTSNPIGAWTGSAYTGLTGAIASGRNGSATPLWDGSTGIVTSQSQATAGNFTTIGIAKASDVRPNTVSTTTTWAGQTITGTDVLVMYTYGGDATLDGKINIDDYIRIDNGISAHLTGWSNGDFNYDGKVNIDDYTQFIDANIGTQGAPFSTSSAALDSLVAVPEPGGWVAAIMGVAFVARARRHRGFHRRHPTSFAR